MLGICRGKVSTLLRIQSDAEGADRSRLYYLGFKVRRGSGSLYLDLSSSYTKIDLSGRVKSNKAFRDGRRSSACSKCS
jgi:hypothetical protein